MRWAVVVMVVAAGAGADDAAPARCDLRVIHALKEGSGIDPRITRLRPYLERAPFTAWHQFKLLDDKQLDLQPNGSADFDLPNGRKGTLTYLGHSLAPDGDHRLRLNLVLDKGGTHGINTIFKLDEGGVVMQAGQKYQSGLLIIGLSCKTEK
jgi:hypothetical protein